MNSTFLKNKVLTVYDFFLLYYDTYYKIELLLQSVDEFFSKLESQKIDMKAISQEKAALKRLENVKEDHEKRLEALKSSQVKKSKFIFFTRRITIYNDL